MPLLIDRCGQVRCVSDEVIDLTALGVISISRASHVEPDAAGQWFVDLAPVGGPSLAVRPMQPSSTRRARVARSSLARLTPARRASVMTFSTVSPARICPPHLCPTERQHLCSVPKTSVPPCNLYPHDPRWYHRQDGQARLHPCWSLDVLLGHRQGESLPQGGGCHSPRDRK